MKKTLLILGLLVHSFTFILWAWGGFHLGWSRSKTPITQVDEITQIEYTTYQEGFVAGIDTLGIGIVIGLALIAISFFIKQKQQ